MSNHSIWYRIVHKTDRKMLAWAERLRLRRLAIEATENTKARVKLIGGGYGGSKAEYRDTVLRYWSKYGIKPGKCWYDLYCNGKSEYDPRFIPDSVWLEYIIPHFNNSRVDFAYRDKGLYRRLFSGVAYPETVVKKVGDYYYDGDGEHLISREEAERLCAQEESLILKPLRGLKGQDIAFYDKAVNSSEDVTRLFDQLRPGFVAQRFVKQHPDLERVNPSSLNTIRVMSFHFHGVIHILSAQLRMGGVGSRVDNVSAGGRACAIHPDGTLFERSVTRKSAWTDETPSGIKYKDIRVPNFETVLKTAKSLHQQLPYFNIVGWDIAVGADGSPVFIEFNTSPEQNQIGCGSPTFGDLSDEVLDEVFIRKSGKKSFMRFFCR